MPATVLGSWNTPVNDVDKDSCPQAINLINKLYDMLEGD